MGNNKLFGKDKSSFYASEGRIKGAILSRARKNKDIIYGAQSIRKQIGLTGRNTYDYDVFTKYSKRSAFDVEKKFDKITHGDNFFVKKGANATTWKVKWKGLDNKKGTHDDRSIVDYTKTPRPQPDTVSIGGIRYRTIGEELKAKKRIVNNPVFAYRREKDNEDIKRIFKAGRNVRRG